MLGGRRFLLACALLAAGVLLALAFHLPLVRMSRLAQLGQAQPEHSLISAVHSLVVANQVLLGGLLLALAILIPLLKLLYLLLLAVLPRGEHAAPPLRALAWLGLWSPHDILALAAMSALVASQPALAPRLAAGAYCFVAATLVMVLAYTWLRADAGLSATAPAAPRGAGFGALVTLAVLAFAVGLTQPAVRLRGGEGQSIVEIVQMLQARREAAIWVPIAILAVVLPGLKLMHLAIVAAASAMPRAVRASALRISEAVGRHATLDGMALCLVLYYLTATGQADTELQPGAYGLATSAALAMTAYAWASLPTSGAPAKPPSRLKDKLAKMAPAGDGATS